MARERLEKAYNAQPDELLHSGVVAGEKMSLVVVEVTEGFCSTAPDQ